MRKQLVQGKPYYRIERQEIEGSLVNLVQSRSGAVDWITLHWTAGSYKTPYKSYQVLIGPTYILVSFDLLNFARHQHTYHRNSRNIGVSFMAMANGYPVTESQMEMCAQVCAILKKKYSIQWTRLQDHAFWAKKDGYPGLRWDVRKKLNDGESQSLGLRSETVFERVVRKSKWYFDHMFTDTEPVMRIVKEDDHIKAAEEAPAISNGGDVFDDVPNTLWSADAIEDTYKMSLMVGSKTSDGHNFRPKEPASREEVAVGLHKLKKILWPKRKDKEHWAYKDVEALAKAGVLKGSGKNKDGTPHFDLFRPVDMGTLIVVVGKMILSADKVVQALKK